MSEQTNVLLPDIGDFTDVEVIEVLVAVGDEVAVEDSLVTLESDKATMEIPSSAAGKVVDIKVAVGDKLNQGDLIVVLEGEAGAPAAAPAAETAAEPVPEPAPEAPAAAEPEPVEAAAPVAEAAVSDEPLDVNLPDIGDFRDVEVIEILVGPGDEVEAEASLITLESEKATMEIPSPRAGVIEEISVSVGDRINQGQLIGRMRVRAGGASAPAAVKSDASPSELEPEPTAPMPPREPAAPAARAPGDKEQKARPVIARPSDAPKGRSHASPAVRRFARELGVDLMRVQGSAPKGRITKEDVQGFVKKSLAGGQPAAAPSGGGLSLPSMPEIDFGKFGEIEEQELGRIKKLSGAHLHRAWLNVPHVTQFDDADITELEAFRKSQKDEAGKQGIKLTFMPFLMKAVAKAMARFPQINASLSPDAERLILKKYVHIGVAVDTPNGLVVPVIRDVDKKSVFELGAELGEMGDKARNGKLAPGDMQGGCLSISSLGGIGGTQFTPIVNAPEVAIIGVSRAEMQPKWDGSAFQPRLIMPFSLSYDHRVIDGAEGVRFTTYLAGLLSDIRRLVL